MAAEAFRFDGALDPWKLGQILPACHGSVLDVGCNTGNLVACLQQQGRHAEGIDVDPAHIAQARRDHPGGSFHLGADLSRFKDGQFETVVAWNVLEHIEDHRAALREMTRIASRNVLLSLPKEDDLSLPDSRVTYRPYVDLTHFHYYRPDTILAMAHALGFRQVQVSHISRARPLLAYAKLGVPRWLCAGLDELFWRLSRQRDSFYSSLRVDIDVSGGAAGHAPATPTPTVSTA